MVLLVVQTIVNLDVNSGVPLLSQSLQPGRYGFRWSDEGRVKQEAIFGGI